MYMRYELVEDAQGIMLSCLGIYDLHILPASHQLLGRRAGPDNYDAWSSTSSPPLASEPCPPYRRHLRPTYLLGHKTGDIAIRLAEANTGSRINRYESHWDL